MINEKSANIMKILEAQFNRWIHILRAKAEYEHKDRLSNLEITQPDIDSICNEMEAFKSGFSAGGGRIIKVVSDN